MIAIGEGNVKLGIVEAGSEASFLKCLLPVQTKTTNQGKPKSQVTE